MAETFADYFDKGVDEFWRRRLNGVKKALEKNNFDVFLAETKEDAKRLALEEIIPPLGAKTVSLGGSTTTVLSGLIDALRDSRELEFLEQYGTGQLTQEQRYENAKRTTQVDLFVTGTNAITDKGQLVNLDMFGNRVTGIAFGPKNTLILVGRNKIVPDLESAFAHVRESAALLGTWMQVAGGEEYVRDRPCGKTSRCSDCSGNDRICNVWGIIEKSYPAGRIKIILINEDIGLGWPGRSS